MQTALHAHRATAAEVPFRAGWYRIPDDVGIWVCCASYSTRDGRRILVDEVGDLAAGATTLAEAEVRIRAAARRRGWRHLAIDSLCPQRYVCFVEAPTPKTVARYGIGPSDWRPTDFALADGAMLS